MTQIDLAQAKANLSELLEKALNGEEVTITKDNEPVVKLVPVPPKKKRFPAYFGSAKGRVWMSDDFDAPLEELKEYM